MDHKPGRVRCVGKTGEDLAVEVEDRPCLGPGVIGGQRRDERDSDAED